MVDAKPLAVQCRGAPEWCPGGDYVRPKRCLSGARASPKWCLRGAKLMVSPPVNNHIICSIKHRACHCHRRRHRHAYNGFALAMNIGIIIATVHAIATAVFASTSVTTSMP